MADTLESLGFAPTAAPPAGALPDQKDERGETDEQFASRLSGQPFRGFAKPGRGKMTPPAGVDGMFPDTRAAQNGEPSKLEDLGFEPRDPTTVKPNSLSELPSPEEFSLSHNKVVDAFHRGMDAAKSGYDALTNLLPAAGAAVEKKVGPIAPHLQDILRPPTQYDEPEPTTTAGKIAKGAATAVVHAGESLTSPQNLGILAATGGAGEIPLLSRAISGYFSADMLKSAYDQFPQVKAAVKSKDPQKIAEAVTGLGTTALMGLAAGAHALHGTVPRGTSAAPEAPKLEDFGFSPEPNPGPDTRPLTRGDEKTGPPIPAKALEPTSPPPGLQGKVADGKFTLYEEDGKPAVTIPLHDKAGTAELLDTLKANGHTDAAQVLEKATSPTLANEPLATANEPLAKDSHESTELPTGGKLEDLGFEPQAPETTQDQSEPQVARNIPRVDTLRPEVAAGLAEGSTRVNPKGGVETLRSIPIGQIHEAAPTEERPQGNVVYPDRVEHYKNNPSPVAPELRVDPDGGYAIWDGHHRVAAAIERGDSNVKAWVSKPGEDGLPKVPSSVYGKDVDIAVPGESKSYPARYAVRELSDVEPSHNPQSFEANPAYEHLNDRDYSQPANAARVVKNASPEVFNPAFPTTESPTAEHGAPIIDERGNVLGGNSRSMSLARVYARNGGHADAYRRTVLAKAEQLGIDPEKLKGMKQPVLLRELSGDVDAQKAITDFNKGAPAALSPEERAVSDGRRLSDKTVADLGARLGDSAEGSTMAEALRGDNGGEVIQNLVRDGVLTEQEKGGYLDEAGNLTPEAKARISKALVGRLFETPSQFRETPAAMRGKLEQIAPQVLRVEGREGWKLTDKTREALALIEDARAHGIKNVDDVANQESFGTGQRGYTPEARAIARTLQESPRNAEYAFRRYANDEVLSREGSQSTMFEPPTREEAFADAFGETGPATEIATKPATEIPNSVAPTKERGFAGRLLSDTRGSLRIRPRSSEPSLFDAGEEDKAAKDAETDKAKLDKDRMEAQLNAPVTREEQLKKLKRVAPADWKDKPQTQAGFFGEAGRPQGGLFDDTEGSFKPQALLDRFKMLRDKMKEAADDPRGERFRNAAFRLGTRVAMQGNGAGAQLMKMIERSELEGGVDAGRMFARWVDAEPQKLTRDQRFELTDMLEGRGKSADPKVQRAFEAARGITDEVAGEATARGVTVRTKNGKRPFMALQDYFPHTQVGNPDALRSGPIRKDVIENIVRQEIQPNEAAATGMLDEWVNYLDGKQGKLDKVLKYMVDSGQAKDEPTALANLQKNRNNIARAGNVEYSRELNLPFYDPNPNRVIPRVISSSARRLNQIAQFGQEHEKINEEVLKIARFGGNPDFVRKAVDRIVGQVQGGSSAEDRVARFAMALQTLKLPYVGLQHSMQGINTLLATDMPTLAAGMAAAFGKAGKRFSIESGAGAEPAIREALRQAGGGSRFTDAYLRATGLSTMMRFNRALAANSGAQWAKKSFAALQKAGSVKQKAIFSKRLENMGIDPDEALEAGKLSDRDYLRAAKSMADYTMFRNRPQDLPDIFTSSPMGRVMSQFKHWGYIEATMVSDQIKRDFKEGSGRGLRTLLILGTVFPAAGTVVSLVKDKLNGKDREFDSGVDRYVYGLFHSSALGMAGSVVDAAMTGHLLEFAAGPTVGDVSEIGHILAKPGDESDSPFEAAHDKAAALAKFAVKRFGGPANRLLPAGE